MSTSLSPRDYATAQDRFVSLQQLDGPDLNPVCGSKLLTHGQTTDHAIILIHGMTNCPQQYCDLAPLLYEQGYNVLIPRMPRNGLADRNTQDLAELTTNELIDFSNKVADIAHGLGRHITVVGISVGAVVASWIAQFRADVDAALIIAPSFGIVSNLPIANRTVNMAVKQFFLTMPNVMTQRFRPFNEGPAQGYYGFATRGLGAAMQLGSLVFHAARNQPPASSEVLFVLNDSDPAVNNAMSLQLLQSWRKLGAAANVYTFTAEHHLIHDIIDPQQVEQQTAYVYPILLDLIAQVAAPQPSQQR